MLNRIDLFTMVSLNSWFKCFINSKFCLATQSSYSVRNDIIVIQSKEKKFSSFNTKYVIANIRHLYKCYMFVHDKLICHLSYNKSNFDSFSTNATCEMY